MIKRDLIENLHRKQLYSIKMGFSYILLFSYYTFQGRGLEHILEQIFGYLDYYCLRRVELVSVVWQEALLEGKIWKTLRRRNVSRPMVLY